MKVGGVLGADGRPLLAGGVFGAGAASSSTAASTSSTASASPEACMHSQSSNYLLSSTHQELHSLAWQVISLAPAQLPYHAVTVSQCQNADIH